MTHTDEHHHARSTSKSSWDLYDSSSLTSLAGTSLTDLAVPGFTAFDPTTPSFANNAEPLKSGVTATALYLVEPGNTAAIAVTDLNQDALNDCFLISSIGELVLTDPNFIKNMIHQNSNGTETVTLYEEASGKVPTYNYVGAFKKVTEVVTNKFVSDSVNSGATQDVVNGVKEIWPQVIEQAVAQLDGGFSAFTNGGYPDVAMEELTGVQASAIYPVTSVSAATLYTDIEKAMKADDMIIFDTVDNPTSYNLVGFHSYMFDGIKGSGATAAVKLLNPWGYDEPSQLVPLNKLAGNVSEVAFGHY